MSRPRRAPVAVLLASLRASGCGSTVAQGAGQPGSAVGTDGLSVDLPVGGQGPDNAAAAPGAPGGTTGGGAAPGADGGGALVVPGDRATGPGAGPGPSGRAAAAGPGTSGPGVTDKEIFVGLTYTPNGEAANAAIGAAGITRGDEKANANAVIDEINARGGVAGRKLVARFHAYDAQSAQTYEQQDQVACATFTQDNKVFASGGGLSENFSACMENAGVLQVTSGRLIERDRVFFDKYPHVFDVGTLSQDRMMAAQIATLSRLDYYSGWDAALGRPGPAPAKLGVLSFDVPSWNRPLDRVLLPGLARAGYAVDPGLVYRLRRPENQGELAQTAAGAQNAVLRFRQSGVTHVLLLDSSGTLAIAYAGATRNQGYLPRLGVNSATGMQALYDAQVLDASQLAGAVGLGWFPSIDLPAGQGDRYLGGAAKECLDIIKRRTGQTFTSTNAASLALVACDQLFLLARAINNAGPVINRTTVRAALEATGEGFSPALIPSAFFSPARHDGLQRGFDMAWDSGCRCARYRDNGHPIP